MGILNAKLKDSKEKQKRENRTVPMEFKDRILLGDEISLIMLINKLQSSEDIESLRNLSRGKMDIQEQRRS